MSSQVYITKQKKGKALTYHFTWSCLPIETPNGDTCALHFGLESLQANLPGTGLQAGTCTYTHHPL